MNDLEMLSGYEHSIAMENGEERVKMRQDLLLWTMTAMGLFMD